MYAIVNLNGKQYEIEEGRYITVDRLSQEPGESVTLDKVLMVVDGKESKVGAPFVDGIKVKAKVLDHFRGKKLIVYKMRCKKGYRRKQGHRQDYTRIQIESLGVAGKNATAPKKEASPESKPEKKEEN